MQIYLTNVFKEFFLINILLLLPLLLFGMLFSIMKKSCIENIRNSMGYLGTVIFGIIGVPIHELSHLLMCLLFGHKIVEVQLFRPIQGRDDNILGFVRHKFNRNNAYQRAGCFFIGIAPMIAGSCIIVMIINLLFPSIIRNLTYINSIQALQLDTFLQIIFTNTKLILSNIFRLSNLFNPTFWISVYIVVSVSLHMTMSKADFDNSLSGFALLEILLFIIATISNIPVIESNFSLASIEHVSSIIFSMLLLSTILFALVNLFTYLLRRLIH